MLLELAVLIPLRRPYDQIGLLYSNNHGLVQNYRRENATSQLAGNRSGLAHFALCCSYSQIDLDRFEAIQEIAKHVNVLVRIHINIPDEGLIRGFSVLVYS